MNLKKGIVGFYLFIGIFMASSMAGFFADLAVNPYVGHFNAFVPSDYNISDVKYHGYYGPGGIIRGYNNSSIKIVNIMTMTGSGVTNPDILSKYAGEYVRIELAYGSTDDEHLYIHSITDVQIQNGTELSNINDIDQVKFKLTLEFHWWIHLLLSFSIASIMGIGLMIAEIRKPGDKE